MGGGGNWEMVAILQEIGQDMFSKTFLHTIVVIDKSYPNFPARR